MNSLYYAYWDDLPADGGFTIFGGIHILWLIGITVAVIVLSVWYRKLQKRGRRIFLIITACIILGWEIYKDILLNMTGHMEFQYWPLHLCGLAVFIEAAYGFWPNKFCGELSCVACLPGAAAALLFPDWGRYPQWNYMNLHGFCIHGLLVMLPIVIMVSGEYVPKIKRIYLVLLFFAVASPIFYRINVVNGTNFMFLNWPSYDSPFENIYEAHGYAGYIISFVLVVFGVILVMYGIIKLIENIWRKKNGT